MKQIDPSDAPEALNDLGHLAAGVGHHVINAFSAIVSNAEILRLKLTSTTPADPEAVADLIISTALDAASVARRLIDYTRPITSIGPAQVSLDRLVGDFIASRKPQSSPDLVWSSSLAPVPSIRGDAKHLHSMLDELLTNSLEAMTGSLKEVAYSTSVDTRGWVVLEVRDSGQGMDTTAMERAVEPFFTTKSGHAGVGLSIANGIWRRHRGTLSIRSGPGEGTLVRLCVEPSDA